MSQKKLKVLNSGITALYIRVSTDFQFEEGYSVEAQQKKLEQWCQLKDIKKYEFYIDGGWSGSNIDRPEMRRLIRDVSIGKLDKVVVYKLDRLSRSQRDTIFLLEDVFEPNNVSFVSISENFDTTTPYGKAIVGILSVFAQLERENIRERTRMGMYERVKEGKWMGGNVKPFGYDYDANQDILIPNEHAEEVKQIYDLYLQGYSTTKLAQMFPVCSDRQITQILDRVTYLGKISYKGEIIEGRHQPIIDQDTWNKVQIEREKRSNKSIVMSQHLLTGMVYCGRCGAKYRYQKWGKDSVKLYCYSQQKSKPNLIKDPNCDNLRVNADELEHLIINDLFNMTDNLTASYDKKVLSDDKRNKRIYGIEVLENKAQMISNKIKKLYNLYAESDDELLLETIKENQEELNRISKMIAAEKATLSVTDDIEQTNELLVNVRSLWDKISINDKRKILHAAIKKITIDGEDITIDYNIQ